MKDLCHNIRNACAALGGLVRHIPTEPERLLAQREIRRIEDAIRIHQAHYRVEDGTGRDKEKYLRYR